MGWICYSLRGVPGSPGSGGGPSVTIVLEQLVKGISIGMVYSIFRMIHFCHGRLLPDVGELARALRPRAGA